MAIETDARGGEAVRSLVAAARAGLIAGAEAESLVTGVVRMIEDVEVSLNRLAAQRADLIALGAALVEAAPEVMVPVLPGEDTGPASVAVDRARQALVAELATGAGASETTTWTLVETAIELVDHLPGVLDTMRTGLIGDRQARQVVRHGGDLPDAAKAAFEAGVLDSLAADRTAAGVGRAARRWRDRVHPVTPAERHTRAAHERAVHLDPAPDGMAWLTAFLPAVQASAIFDKIDQVARTLGGDPEETRTLAQRRADVLTALALDSGTWSDVCGVAGISDGDVLGGRSRSDDRDREPGCPSTVTPDRAGHLATVTPDEHRAGHLTVTPDEHRAGGFAGTEAGPAPPGTIDPRLLSLRPTVAVTVPVLTLLGRSEEPGNLDGYGPIDPATARALAANAPSFIRILTHPETGAVLSVGRDRYAVPADLRTWLRLRDQTCRFPGCSRVAVRCDVDHTVAFREGGARGRTDAGNLAHLCRKHHRLKHTTRWSVEQRLDGELTWTSPTGRHYASRPGLDLAAVTAVGSVGAEGNPCPFEGTDSG